MTAVEVRAPWQRDLVASAYRTSVAVRGGLVSGVLVGGVGGRLAMLVLRLTSDASLHGLETDDGFVMGRVSFATLFLVFATGVLGIGGALLYLAVRTWLPTPRRALFVGVFGGIVGGALIVVPDGIDFRLLEPLPLAIAFFVLLPAAYGVAMSVLVERGLGREAFPDRPGMWTLSLIPLLLFALLGPLGLGLLVFIPAIWIVLHLAPSVASLGRSQTVVWIGRVALLAVTAVALVELVRNVTRVLDGT